MSYCSKCGTQINEGEKYCSKCGNLVAQEADNQKETNGESSEKQNDFVTRIQDLNSTADTTAAYAVDDVTQNKAMGILAYFGPLVLIPILAAPKSMFARFHSNQGLVLLLADIAYSIINAILTAIFWAISWRLGSIMSSILGLVWILFMVLAIIGIVNAASGRAKELPIIGKIKILK